MPSAAELADGDLVLRPWRDEDAELVGFTPRSPEAWGNRPFEVGYYLRRDVWGRGLATRSLILVRDWLDQPLELCTHPRNERSQRVAERAGFRRDGVLENYARFKDGETTAWRYVWP